MIIVAPIPLALDPAELAEALGMAPADAQAMAASAGAVLRPAGAFDRVEPGRLEGYIPRDSFLAASGSEWIAAVLTLGVNPQTPWTGFPHPEAWPRFIDWTLGRALDFLAYRIRLYLKPLSKVPGLRFNPGCPELPESARAVLLALFGPETLDRLRFDSRDAHQTANLVMVYAVADRELDPALNPCLACARKDCLGRRH
jgi:hypothetical protein